MSRLLDKGKQRAGGDHDASNKAMSQTVSLASQRRPSKADPTKTSARGMQRSHQPSSSSSSKRQQNLSPPSSESESELDDLELEHESEDEFEQYRNEAAPSYAQYQGDSDLDEAAGDDSEVDQSGASGSDAGSTQEEMEEEHDYLDDVQADLQQIPLETLIKAQKKLNKLSKPSTSKAAQSQSNEPQEASTSNRRGRTEARRGVVANLPNVSQKEARSKLARPKARDSKHAPTEVTSKRAVPRFRQVVEVEKTNRRDPRFDALSGELDDNRFRTSYSFIDEARQEEIKRLRYALSVARKRRGAVDLDELDAMADELQRLQSKQAESERQRRQATVMSEWKHQEKEKRSSGKSEFYLKRGEKKKMVESKRMEEVSQDKRKLRKVMKRKDQAEKKKSIKSAPPVRQM